MNIKTVAYILGRLVLAEAGVMLVPFVLAQISEETVCARAFAESVVLCAVPGFLLLKNGVATDKPLTLREGIAVTALGWVLASVLGMLPYATGGYLGILDGIFESISGFTGTGATVFVSLENLPPPLHFWRMMTHWFGGLGIIVIFIALLPQAGQGAAYMYNAEATGPVRERVLPRLRDMAFTLFKMYLLFTCAATIVYMLCGLGLRDAVMHAMSTIGTGGFSTYDANAMHFDNPLLEGCITFFMVLAGGNFALYYRAYKKGFSIFLRNTEFLWYLAILVGATCCITLDLILDMGIHTGDALRYASFQVGSIATTGFVSADFDVWPSFSKGVLIALMVGGGCAGSTAGGIKIARVVILARGAWAAIRQKLAPRVIVPVHVNGAVIPSEIVHRVFAFFFLYMSFIGLWTVLLTFDGIQVFDALGLSVTTMGSVGPAFGIAGATKTYADLSTFVKSVLCISMLLGRLELYTLLVLLTPDFWRKGGHW